MVPNIPRPRLPLGFAMWWGVPMSLGRFCDHHFVTKFYGFGHKILPNVAFGIMRAKRREVEA